MMTLDDYSQTGHVFWITGLAGAGKSTIARTVAEKIRDTTPNVVFIDADDFRKLIGDNLGHEPHERLANAWRMARFCKYLSDQKLHVVAATISLYHEVRDWLRSTVPHYHEIFVKVSLETLHKRNQKGLYSGAEQGLVKNVAGINLEVEFPEKPDLVIINDEEQVDFAKIADRIIELAKSP